MFREILRSRELLIALIFFVIVIGGSLLYSWHIRGATDAELSAPEKVSQQRTNQNETLTAADTVEGDFGTSEPPLEYQEAQATADDLDALASDDTAPVDLADALVKDATTIEGEENDRHEVPDSGHKAHPEESSEDLQSMTPEELVERLRAEAVLQEFLESRPDMEIPLEEILKDPAIASKIKGRLIGPGRLYIHTPEAVSEALRTLNENQ